MPFVADSQHTTINNGHFTDQSIGVINNVANISLENGQTGIDILLEASNPDAAHDSSARDYDPRCHPGTREQYIKDILGWGAPAFGADESLPLYWMKGLGGVGKSAIAQTCAEKFKEMGKLGATFFFSENERDDAAQFFPTIAYQLSTEYPEYQNLVDQKVRRDKTIVKKTMAVQFKALIVEPLQELKKVGKGIRQRIVIIVDGLDECSSADAQCKIIQLIAAAAHDGATPLCWAFFSRPESHIRATFTLPDVVRVTCTALLPASDDANSDIELYLRSGFENILRRRNILSQWPSDDDMRTLVKASNGLFVYAATALRVIDRALSPEEALRAVCATTLNCANGSPFAELDAFYMLIMRRIPPEKLPTVLLLCKLLCSAESYPGRGWKGGAMLWGNVLALSEIELRTVYNQLSAVLHIHDHGDSLDPTQFGDPDRPFQYATGPARIEELRVHVESRLGGSIYFYHKSFYDFLVDPTRSGTFHIRSLPLYSTIFRPSLELVLRVDEGRSFRGSELVLTPGVPDSASFLSWPSTNELVNSILKAQVYHRTFETCFQIMGRSGAEPQLLQRFSNVDFRRARQNEAMLYAEGSGFLQFTRWGCDGYSKVIHETQLFHVLQDEFQRFNVVKFNMAIKRLQKAGIIRPYHPNFASRLKSLILKKSQDKLTSGLYRMGHGPKSIFWYWEINFESEYYQEFLAVDLAEGERIYREERFDLWSTECGEH